MMLSMTFLEKLFKKKTYRVYEIDTQNNVFFIQILKQLNITKKKERQKKVLYTQI